MWILKKHHEQKHEKIAKTKTKNNKNVDKLT